MPLYRNVTLAGAARAASGVGGTELDLRLRRNAFDLTAQPPVVAIGSSGAASAPSVLTLADLTLVNLPQGPPDSWPLGLMSGWSYYTTRLMYLNFWYVRLASLSTEEAASAEWLRHLVQPTAMTRDADNGTSRIAAQLNTRVLGWNSSGTSKPLLTVPMPLDFAPWLVPATAAVPAAAGTVGQAAAVAAAAAAAAALPPSSCAVALNATQLSSLLQEPWTDGPRAVFLMANISLASSGSWPQAGPRLAYNVALVGPASGPPVWLDAGVLPLAQGPATAPGSVGSDGAQAGVALALARLRLVGLAASATPSLMNASAVAAVGGSAQLDSWRDSIVNSVVEVPEGHLLALAASAETTSVCGAVAGTEGQARTLAAACKAEAAGRQPPQSLPAAVASLLNSVLSLQGQGQAVATLAPWASVLYGSGSLGGAGLANTTFLITSVPAGADEPPCSPASLITAASSTLDAAVAPASSGSDGGDSSSAAVIGGAVGGAIGGACLLAALAALALAYRRRRQAAGKESGSDGSLVDPEAGKGAGGGPPTHQGKAPGPGLLESEQMSWSGPTPSILATRTTATAGELDSNTPLAPAAATAVAAAMEAGGSSAAEPAAPAPVPGACVASEDAFSNCFREASVGRWRSHVEAMGDRAGLGAGGGRPPGPPFRPGGGAPPVLLDRGRAALVRTPSAGSDGGATPLSHKSGGRSAAAAMAGRIQDMIAKQSAKAGPSPGTPREAARGRFLGRGAYGCVYLGAFRNLPAAIKVIPLYPGDTDKRAERVAREVMLTSTLSHANVLPTYYHEIKRVRVDEEGKETELDAAAPSDSSLGAEADGAQGWDAIAEASGCMLRLRIFMQYCEGGSLASALVAGSFGGPSAPHDRSGRTSTEYAPQPQPKMAETIPEEPDTDTAPATRPRPTAAPHASEQAQECLGRGSSAGAAEAKAPQEQAQVAAVSAEEEVSRGLQRQPNGEGSETTQSGASVASTPQQQQQQQQQPSDGGSIEAPAGGSGKLVKRRSGVHAVSLSWEDLERSPGLTNLPYALLAAIDVARGLEYLHGQGVIHGDVNDNNVLLKAARPLLPGLGLGLDGGVLSSAGSIRASMPRPRTVPSASVRAPYGPQPMPLAGVAPSAPTSDAAAGDGDPRGLPATPGFGALQTSGAIPPAFDPTASLLASGASGAMALEVAAAEMLGWVFKLADFGLSVQLAGPSQTHVSNLAQGTPFFVAPEVLLAGHLSPAADIYSFGVLLWLLLHGVCTRQVVHLLPRNHQAPIAPLLLRHAAPGLPPSAARLLARCLSQEPGDRPPAAQLRQELETVMREVAGPELAQLLLGTERKEVVVAV
ncbi:hypothetical protein HYH03_014523 [Edaphochlamys debaryana]|uniref:Protein kinase domain-containing protein n=1 Tax=Edaphochlamys debaryana TaxID=47281 RepID=A0A835XNQ1_9CHLO|nr:hypothetical protein HYH03_014523 [Edaphochlamys debaryana]|eukprot:KAG2486840.1 hypothetical protein HYH03_014523 [Edaphochlamys debaryana]